MQIAEKMRPTIVNMALLGLAVVMTGCSAGDSSATLESVPPIKADNPKFATHTGWQANVDADPAHTVQEIAKTKTFGHRVDAFGLLAVERQFENSQMAARLLSESGGFRTDFEPPSDESEAPPVVEPLPAWRLAGVVIGDGVAALLDMGGGKVIDIRPGMKIPDTDWVVVSIDPERAVLRREGKALPKYFTVPLQDTIPQGVDQGNQGGGGAGGGGNVPGGGRRGGGGTVAPGDQGGGD